MATKEACNLQVDYSTVPGSRVLPFEIFLDVEKSVLYPEEGQLQRFCYIIECKGQNAPIYADPEFFILGICPSIAREHFERLEIAIDGISQRAVWGQDVELLTDEPDSITGNRGLKINYSLDKVAGVMQICFTLRECYDIGPVNICSHGEGATVTGESIGGPVSRQVAAVETTSPANPNPINAAEPVETVDPGKVFNTAEAAACASCQSTFYQTETVSVPVAVKPYAVPGETSAVCCGDPTIARGKISCHGDPSEICYFTVSQKLCIEIPITFGAEVRTGEAVTQCGQVSDSCCDCGTIITSDPR